MEFCLDCPQRLATEEVADHHWAFTGHTIGQSVAAQEWAEHVACSSVTAGMVRAGAFLQDDRKAAA